MLNMDFKGLLESKPRNQYLLTIIDGYSRFPFVYPCPDTSTSSVIKCLRSLFALYGAPTYIHSDRRTLFISEQLRQFLHRQDGSSKNTTALFGKLFSWLRRIECAQSLTGESLLPESLGAIRTLFCSAMNATPRERSLPFQRRTSRGTLLST